MDAVGRHVALRVVRRGGRALLDHCWDDTEHTGDSGATHDGVSTRIAAWFVNLMLAVALLIYSVRTWPPPERVFPRRRPLLTVPWCCWARILGYGVFDWRTGRLAPWIDFLRERHEILNVFAGDSKFTTKKCRFAHLLTELASTAAVSMVLTDLTTAKVSGGFWTKQIWVFALLMTYDIVLGIALRLAALGATKASFEAAENVGFECAENGELMDLENEEQLIEMGIKATRAFNAHQNRFVMVCFMFSCTNLLVSALWTHLSNPADGCGDSVNTFMAYIYVFGLYQGFNLIVISPMSLSVRWSLAAFLVTRIPEVKTPQETMNCCWRARCPTLCGCVPPLVTPLDQRTVSRLFMSPRKVDRVTTRDIAAVAAAAGTSRYSSQESPLTPMTPVPEMTRDAEPGQNLFPSPSPRYTDDDASTECVDEEMGTPVEVTPELQRSLSRSMSHRDEPSPADKYDMLRRQVSMRSEIDPSDIDYVRYPDGNLEDPSTIEEENQEPEQIAGESAFAAARMALMSAGKLTPEQASRTKQVTHNWNTMLERSADHDESPSVTVAEDIQNTPKESSPPTYDGRDSPKPTPPKRRSSKSKESAESLFDEKLDEDPWGEDA